MCWFKSFTLHQCKCHIPTVSKLKTEKLEQGEPELGASKF